MMRPYPSTANQASEAPGERPLVSIIVPCYNEQDTIRLVLEAIYLQTFPRHQMEVIIADGQSTDHTREEIAAYHASHRDLSIRVVENPDRVIPAGLNRALEAARGQYIVRLDAHSMPQPDYVDRCLAALEAGLGENVGGVWEIHPQKPGWIAAGIAAAAAHPFGVGDARYRYTRTAQSVDTVPFGAFRRDLVERIGAFDETLLTNEDYEFNVRVRQSGGKVWLDPAIRSVYLARPTLRELARQYWRYGYWKLRMLLRYPQTLRWRQLAGLLVLSLVVLAMLAPWVPLAASLLALETGVYLAFLLTAGVQAAWRQRRPYLALGVPMAIATMHFAWGSGFLWSLIQALARNRRTRA